MYLDKDTFKKVSRYKYPLRIYKYRYFSDDLWEKYVDTDTRYDILYLDEISCI